MKRVKNFLLFTLAGTFMFMALVVSANANTVSVILNSVNGKEVGGAVYADPYCGTINGKKATLVCDDFSHDTYIGESWTATVSTFSDLTNARFYNKFGETGYEEVGYLYYTLLKADSSNYADISLALWAVFDPNLTKSSWWNSTAGSYLSDAQKNYGEYNYSNLEILTPTGNGFLNGSSCGSSPQEFITTSVPEPASLFLVLGVMLGFGLIRRRRTA